MASNTIHASRSRRSAEHDRNVVERIRTAAATHLGIELRDVQVAAGRGLLGRCIAEMQTGEGKTLTTVIPAALMASADRRSKAGSVLIATANDYLAARDAEWMRPIYQELGLRVGSIISESSSDHRRRGYDCDVTYGTLSQFAFDYLRASLARRGAPADPTALPINFDTLIVDEADSLLIDEARTPMVITAPRDGIDDGSEAGYRWSAQQATSYHIEVDYVRLLDTGSIALTERGRGRAMNAPMPPVMGLLTTTDILHGLERAIWVNENIRRDDHYVIKEGRIHLIDEYTGRKVGQRNFGGGIHQAVEAREGLDVTPESEPVARVSVQDFAAMFKHLCGLTATAWEDRQELRNVYGLAVKRFPTYQACRRKILDPVVCRSRRDKWQRIVDEAQSVLAAGRAVLIGTRTIEQSEQLSEKFRLSAIGHVVLNARNPQQEAAIISHAGQTGRVTIATNMAGRGTDIRLEPHVAAAGGLHVIVSEVHAAARIDRQLIGRCARQGDPGTARVYASPEDEILVQAFGQERARQIRQTAESGTSDRRLLAKVRQAQRRVAKLHRQERARLTAHEASLAESMQLLGLDPHLDPLPEVGR